MAKGRGLAIMFLGCALAPLLSRLSTFWFTVALIVAACGLCDYLAALQAELVGEVRESSRLTREALKALSGGATPPELDAPQEPGE